MYNITKSCFWRCNCVRMKIYRGGGEGWSKRKTKNKFFKDENWIRMRIN